MTAPSKISFTVPLIAPSKKNRQRIRKRGRYGARFVAADEQVETAEMVIALAALAAVEDKHLVRDRSLFGDHEVAATITIDEVGKQMLVEVEDLGPKPKGRTNRRRDVHNVADAVMDALQGIVFDDDRQSCRTTCQRGTVREGPCD